MNLASMTGVLSSSRPLRLLLSLAVFSAACADDPDIAPEGALPSEAVHGDHGQDEVALSGAALRAQWAPDGAFLRSSVIASPATRVGLLMELTAGAPTPLMEARGIRAGEPGPWRRLEVTWEEDGQLVARTDLGALADGGQLRLTDAEGIRSLIWAAVVPEEPRAPELPTVTGDGVGATRSALRSDLAAVGVISREEWGARSTSCASDPDKSRMAIHHTVTPADTDPAVRVRGIQNFHMDTRGWCDIGYHFLVSLDGRMWEGRPLGQLGTHVGGHNTGNIGISYIGCFHSSGCNDWTPFTPPDAMLDAGATLVREMSRIYGIAIDPTNVKGHRDHAGASTSCPGDNLHALLPEIRTRAGEDAAPVWSAAFVEQSFPLARDPFVIPPGDEVAGYIELRNTGTEPWEPGETFLGTTEPRDGASPLVASDWISESRAATVDGTVAPGATGRFEFSVRAPLRAGDYPQFFNLVQEGVAWFSAPADDQLQVRVTVERDGVPGDAGVAGDMDPSGDLGRRPDGSLEGDGCGCRVTAPRQGGAGGWFALGFFALLARRRFR